MDATNLKLSVSIVAEVNGVQFVWGPPGGCSGRTTRILRCPASPSLSGLVRGGVHALAPHDTVVNSLAAKHAALAHARDAMRRAHALSKYYVRDRELPGERDIIIPVIVVVAQVHRSILFLKS